jgi:diguanylate cyclase (GGDEF)-like protein/PAS domain S-box-containing protein
MAQKKTKKTTVRKKMAAKATPKKPALARKNDIKVTAMTKPQLIEDLARVRRSMSRLEKSEARRKVEEEKLGLKLRFMESASQALAVTDTKTEIVYANEQFIKMFGYPAKNIIGKNPMMLCSSRNDDGIFTNMKESLARDGKWQGEIWGRKKNRKAFPSWVSISAIKDGGGKTSNYSGIAIDISELKKNEQRLERMAHYDVLTNLPNRTLMKDRLAQALILARRYKHAVAVMLLDLDRFKEVNDTMGHHVGDQLLIEASRRLTELIRESDTIARLGGDEFLVILPEIRNANDAAHIAQKFVEVLALPFKLEGQDVFISGSIGIAVYPTDSEDADSLINNADTAMYHAKAQGKNNFKFFTEDINKSTIERFVLELNFRRALEKLEFQLNYQPKVDILTGRIKGMEALLRWYHPEQGTVKPGLFIPLAEETGLVVPLGEWVLREACRQNVAWQSEGLPHLRVSVNLSARHFHKRDLTDMIGQILEETGLDPECLMLEITETTTVENMDETISIDDFGTGYSSLNYLNRFAVSEIKIDRTFTSEVMKDADSRKVITAIIALAHSLNMSVVAEGVETKDQLDFMKKSNCDEIQGYYFSKPLSSEEFRKLVRAGMGGNDGSSIISR